MTLWIIGDSYSICSKSAKRAELMKELWTIRTAKTLGEDVISLSKPSVPVEYIFHKFNDVRHRFKENDIILMTIPYFERRWYFRKSLLKIFFATKQENEAIEFSKKYLNNFHDLHSVYLINFLHNVNDITKKLNLHTIIIPTFVDTNEIIQTLKDDFDSINFSNTSLSTITIGEFKPEAFTEETMTWLQNNDTRPNHLTRTNHEILSNKIIDNIKNKTPIDLTQDFKTNFLNQDLFKDPTFVKEELFNGVIERLHRIKFRKPT